MRAWRGAVVVVALTIVLVPGVVWAGSTDSPAGPDDPASAMATMEDVYDRLVSGANYVLRTTFVEPAAGPGSTGHTLQEVMNVAPEADDTDGAVVSEVVSGKKYWGLRTDGGGWSLQTGTGAPAPVGETGQVTCYDAGGTVVPCTGTGQDGDLRPGVAWPVPRFTDNGNGTVTDNLTGLTWLRNANCDHTKTWVNALTWANGLYDGCSSCGGTNNDCGLTDGSVAGDWRLPSRFELESLLDLEYYLPALSNAAGTGKWTEGDAFSGVQSGTYWSSTSYASGPVNAWIVYLYTGYVNADHKSFSGRVGSQSSFFLGGWGS